MVGIAVAVVVHQAEIQMGHERGVVAHVPGLGEIGLHLQELGVWGLVEILVLLVPFLAEGHHAERDEVAGFGERCLPHDGIAVGCRTAIGIGEAHLGHELVFRHRADEHQGVLEGSEL